MSSEVLDAYLQGYQRGVAQATAQSKPYMTVADIAERYDVGIGKARDILNAVRMFCNGGKLNHESRVLVAEVEYWESVVDTRKKERL